jgi:hypothetical protein
VKEGKRREEGKRGRERKRRESWYRPTKRKIKRTPNCPFLFSLSLSQVDCDESVKYVSTDQKTRDASNVQDWDGTVR